MVGISNEREVFTYEKLNFANKNAPENVLKFYASARKHGNEAAAATVFYHFVLKGFFFCVAFYRPSILVSLSYAEEAAASY